VIERYLVIGGNHHPDFLKVEVLQLLNEGELEASRHQKLENTCFL